MSVSDILTSTLVKHFSLVPLIQEFWSFPPETCIFCAFLNGYIFGVSLITMA